MYKKLFNNYELIRIRMLVSGVDDNSIRSLARAFSELNWQGYYSEKYPSIYMKLFKAGLIK